MNYPVAPIELVSTGTDNIYIHDTYSKGNLSIGTQYCCNTGTFLFAEKYLPVLYMNQDTGFD